MNKFEQQFWDQSKLAAGAMHKQFLGSETGCLVGEGYHTFPEHWAKHDSRLGNMTVEEAVESCRRG